MNFDFLIQLLAKVWDWFKVRSPHAAAIVALFLGTLIYFAQQNTLLGVISLPENVSKVLEVIVTVWLGLNGSRTTQFLNKKNP